MLVDYYLVATTAGVFLAIALVAKGALFLRGKGSTKEEALGELATKLAKGKYSLGDQMRHGE